VIAPSGAALAIEPDKAWFLDHGRRDLRFRPSIGGEPAGQAVLAHRDGRKWGWPINSPAAFRVNAEPDALQAIFAAVSQIDTLRLEKAAEPARTPQPTNVS
jgi:hypothetical protein